MHEGKSRSPVVLVTGAAGEIGTALIAALGERYHVIGLDVDCTPLSVECIPCDLTSETSLGAALETLHSKAGGRLAAVVHLAAYFDFTGKENPLYQSVNIDGTDRLVTALKKFDVERFIYASTMLVYAPGVPGERIDEQTPREPRWAYPKSKKAAEDIILEKAGTMPVALLQFAGVYDERNAPPTMAHQMARLYERTCKSRLFSGNPQAGQSALHRKDAVHALIQAIDKRHDLPERVSILIGEEDAPGYARLQDRLGRLIHGAAAWRTFRLPSWFAKAGAWLEARGEPLIPDFIDKGEKPFVRPFMIDLASDHYALDIGKARDLLSWEPAHSLDDTLPAMVQRLKDDPVGWYHENSVALPLWMRRADALGKSPGQLRADHEARYKAAHDRNLWGAFLNMALATWLLAAPFVMEYRSAALTASDLASGVLILILALASLSWRHGWARWGTAVVGLWLLAAPLIFWAPTAAAYNNGTITGMLAIGFAVLTRPPPGVGILASTTGPDIPPGWDFSPSSWFQRLPIIVLAVIGLHLSRYMAAYQLGHIEGVWDPFFTGSLPGRNGTEDIITSSVSKAWPVPDAGLGAFVYALEILTGIIGSRRRWRTMPWLVILFGIMIVPLGIVSITFIIIQPIVIGTWCTLCLIAAAAMLLQIPYALDELVATGQFLARRRRAGASMLAAFLFGDTDEHPADPPVAAADLGTAPWSSFWTRAFDKASLPWNLGLTLLIGIWLMMTRLTLGSTGALANAEHLIGALVVTVTVTAMAEVARAVRLLTAPLGAALCIVPFFLAPATPVQKGADLLLGLALIALSLRRGPVSTSYGRWDRFVI